MTLNPPTLVHIRRMQKAITVWFDGGCPLCRKEINLVRRLDRRRAINFVDVAVSADPGCPIDRGDLLATFHARENGVVLSGAAAFAAMWRAIPLLKPLSLIARIPIVLTALDKLYLKFLRYRPRLQRLLSQR